MPDVQFYSAVAAGPETNRPQVRDGEVLVSFHIVKNVEPGPSPTYLPDLYIKNTGENDTKYVLKDKRYCGTFVAFQTKEQSITDTNKAIYYVTIEQGGANNDDIISVTGTGNSSAGGGNWAVKYYEVANESDVGIDKTSEIVSGYGYALAAGIKQLIRAEITPDVNVVSGTAYAITVTATSTLDSSRNDVVRAITTAIEDEEITTGSSGVDKNHKHKTWYKCGYLGIEPFILLGVIWLMRKRGTKRN